MALELRTEYPLDHKAATGAPVIAQESFGLHEVFSVSDDVHLPLVGADLVDGLAGDAAVQGDKVHTVLGMETAFPAYPAP